MNAIASMQHLFTSAVMALTPATEKAVETYVPKISAGGVLTRTADSFESRIARTGVLNGEAQSNFLCLGKGTKSPVYSALTYASTDAAQERKDIQRQVKHPSDNFLETAATAHGDEASWAKKSFNLCYKAGKRVFGDALEEVVGYTNKYPMCDTALYGRCTPLKETFTKRPEEYLKLGSVNAHGVFSKD
jgi:hypothetical protein